MGVFDRVEKKLENAVSGAFARAFKGDVQPVEITARLQRELDNEAKLLSRERKLVPNEFHVALSQHDPERARRNATRQLERLGYNVTLTTTAQTA